LIVLKQLNLNKLSDARTLNMEDADVEKIQVLNLFRYAFYDIGGMKWSYAAPIVYTIKFKAPFGHKYDRASVLTFK